MWPRQLPLPSSQASESPSDVQRQWKIILDKVFTKVDIIYFIPSKLALSAENLVQGRPRQMETDDVLTVHPLHPCSFSPVLFSCILGSSTGAGAWCGR